MTAPVPVARESTLDPYADGEAYDAHYQRLVDREEDVRLGGLLAPFVDDRSVLDLGCGTGWTLDHLRPSRYMGLDASPAMLDRFHVKHPRRSTLCRVVGVDGWGGDLRFQAVLLSTWAAHYLPFLESVLDDLPWQPRLILWHGNLPASLERESSIAVQDQTAMDPDDLLYVPPGYTRRGIWGTGWADEPGVVKTKPWYDHYAALAILEATE